MQYGPIHLFDKSAQIDAATKGVDAGGSPTRTWAASQSSVPCRVQPASGRTQQYINQRYANRVSHIVYFPGYITINDDDRIVVSGLTMTVLGVVDFDLQAAFKRADCEEVR